MWLRGASLWNAIVGGKLTEGSERTVDSQATEGDLAGGYPRLVLVLAVINSLEDIPDEGVRRLEVNTFASGDATYQVWTTDAEEARGGYITSEQLS